MIDILSIAYSLPAFQGSELFWQKYLLDKFMNIL